MINIGIIGIGGISGAHLAAYNTLSEQATVVAKCDIIPGRAQGNSADITINIGHGETGSLSAVAYTDYRELIADPLVQAVDICLPTELHAEVAIAALEGGKHVLCEKPMAISVAHCDRMIAAARASGRTLMIAHCIRFWPEYAYVKELQESGKYGKITQANFSRLSGLPSWSADSWYLQAARSGGAVQDLHIHDVDFILYLLGKPRAVSVQGRQQGERIDFVSVNYRYADDQIIRAEGGWDFPASFSFRMSFLIRFEHATLEWSSQHAPLRVYPDDGEVITPELATAEGYQLEIAYFLNCLANNVKPTIVTPEDARESLSLVMAEVEAFRSGKEVDFK